MDVDESIQFLMSIINTSSYYRTDDPLENLLLKVVIYEVHKKIYKTTKQIKLLALLDYCILYYLGVETTKLRRNAAKEGALSLQRDIALATEVAKSKVGYL